MDIIEEWLADGYRTHWEGCQQHHIRCAVSAELTRLRALVEKRERQIVWCVRKCVGLTIDERTVVIGYKYEEEFDFDGTDAGLLAAIDEATGER